MVSSTTSSTPSSATSSFGACPCGAVSSTTPVGCANGRHRHRIFSIAARSELSPSAAAAPSRSACSAAFIASRSDRIAPCGTPAPWTSSSAAATSVRAPAAASEPRGSLASAVDASRSAATASRVARGRPPTTVFTDAFSGALAARAAAHASWAQFRLTQGTRWSSRTAASRSAPAPCTKRTRPERATCSDAGVLTRASLGMPGTLPLPSTQPGLPPRPTSVVSLHIGFDAAVLHPSVHGFFTFSTTATLIVCEPASATRISPAGSCTTDTGASSSFSGYAPSRALPPEKAAASPPAFGLPAKSATCVSRIDSLGTRLTGAASPWRRRRQRFPVSAMTTEPSMQTQSPAGCSSCARRNSPSAKPRPKRPTSVWVGTYSVGPRGPLATRSDELSLSQKMKLPLGSSAIDVGALSSAACR